MSRNYIPVALAALAISAGGAVSAFAGNYDGNNEQLEMQAVASARISAAEAATNAAKAGGKVSSVQFTVIAGKPVYHVELVGPDNQQTEVAVDANSGDVTPLQVNLNDDENGEKGGGEQGAD